MHPVDVTIASVCPSVACNTGREISNDKACCMDSVPLHCMSRTQTISEFAKSRFQQCLGIWNAWTTERIPNVPDQPSRHGDAAIYRSDFRTEPSEGWGTPGLQVMLHNQHQGLQFWIVGVFVQAGCAIAKKSGGKWGKRFCAINILIGGNGTLEFWFRSNLLVNFPSFMRGTYASSTWVQRPKCLPSFSLKWKVRRIEEKDLPFRYRRRQARNVLYPQLKRNNLIWFIPSPVEPDPRWLELGLRQNVFFAVS